MTVKIVQGQELNAINGEQAKGVIDDKYDFGEGRLENVDNE